MYNLDPVRAGGFHMLCYQGFVVADYDFTLGCLAYESLRLVQNPGVKLFETRMNQIV